jgi:hypothetical protein
MTDVPTRPIPEPADPPAEYEPPRVEDIPPDETAATSTGVAQIYAGLA